MTREEAKAIVKGFMENPLFSDIPKVCRAFDMAIKALEQESYYKDLAESYEKNINKLTKAIAEQEPCKDVPDTNVGKCEDIISRGAVLDLARKGVLVSNDNFESVCKAINDIPPSGQIE